MYRRNRGGLLPVLFMLLLLVGVFFLTRFWLFSPSRQAVHVVEEFYEYEQTGDYAKSWELLHSSMKERFPKGGYIQDRVHVFMGHFGAETFEFEVGDVKKRTNWKVSKDGEILDTVYEIPVIQYYQGKYGRFDFTQHVYLAEEKGDWVIIWDFNH